MLSTTSAFPAIRDVPYMGVIYVVAEAVKLGFTNGHPDWSNLGQGQPEVGTLPLSPPRIDLVEMRPGDHAYGPVEGAADLRGVIAAHYNRLYRRGAKTMYGPQNVALASGGRAVLNRLFGALGAARVGYQTPDYTAFTDLFHLHGARIQPVRFEGIAEKGHAVPVDLFISAMQSRTIDALLISNPCNPTGNAIRGPDLATLCAAARENGTLLLLDEFYSHYLYEGDAAAAGSLSAAPHVIDIERDPIVLIDGLTKNYRYPGWRIGWLVGPSEIAGAVTRVGSAIDGGLNLPL